MQLDLQPCKTERGSVPPSLSRRCSAVNALAFGFGFFFFLVEFKVEYHITEPNSGVLCL